MSQTSKAIETTQHVVKLASFVASSVEEVRMKYPDTQFNLVLPLRVPRVPDRYELWVSFHVVSQQNDVYHVGGGKFALYKHALQRLAREAGVIEEKSEQVLPSTWFNIVQFAKETGIVPKSEHLSKEWLLHDLHKLLANNANDVAFQVSVIMEIAPGQFVRAIKTAEWIEADELELVRRAVMKQAQKEEWDDERIKAEIDERFLTPKRFRVRLTETKAYLGACRLLLAMPTSFTKEELSRPFLVASWRRALTDEELEKRWQEAYGFGVDEKPATAIVETIEGEREAVQTDAVPVALSEELSFFEEQAKTPATQEQENIEPDRDRPVRPSDWAEFWKEARKLGYKDDEVRTMFGVSSMTEIVSTVADIDNAITVLRTRSKK